jgi:hypothetical protein
MPVEADVIHLGVSMEQTWLIFLAPPPLAPLGLAGDDWDCLLF